MTATILNTLICTVIIFISLVKCGPRNVRRPTCLAHFKIVLEDMIKYATRFNTIHCFKLQAVVFLLTKYGQWVRLTIFLINVHAINQQNHQHCVGEMSMFSYMYYVM